MNIIRSPIKNRESGLALVIIVIILVCLIALGLPFVVSMLTKEKSTRNTFNIAQARDEAQACRNFAIISLYRTHDSYETRTNSSIPYNDSDYDTAAEFKIDLSLINPITNVTDPCGTIWGLAVQDEQGKIDIKMAPKSISRNLSNIVTKNPTGDIREFLTNYSYNSNDWIETSHVHGYTNHLLCNGASVTSLHTKGLSGRYSREGARIRLSNGTKQFFAYVMPSKICTVCNSVWPSPISDHLIHALPPEGIGLSLITVTLSGEIWFREWGRIMLDRLVPDYFLSPFTIIEVADLPAININTAPDEVIMANLLGVGAHWYSMITDPFSGESIRFENDDRITEYQSKQLTDLIRTRVKADGFKDSIDYYNVLSSAYQAGIITDIQFSNLINNNNGTTEFTDLIDGYFTATLPFCFRSYDKYTIISTGITNYPSGTEAAKITNREIVDVTPPGTNLWKIESQYDFDCEFITPAGNPTKFITYPNLTVLGSISFDSSKLPDHSRAADAGELKLKSVEDNRGNNCILTEHFSNTHEGQELLETPISYQASTIFAFQNQHDIMPSGIEMWVKVNEMTTPITFFDIKQNDYENRLSLWYNGSELVLSVCDATIEGKAAQIHAPITLQPTVWYHLGAYWKGTKYAQLALFLDGRPVGNFAHYDRTNQAILTELTAELTNQIAITTHDGAGLIVPVMSAQSFPSSGVLEIGDEAIEYTAKVPGGFRVTQVWQSNPQPAQPDILVYHGRGARGTSIKKHPAGSKVTVYGYSNILRNTINLSGYPALNIDRLTTGGATLVHVSQPGMPVVTQLPDHMPIVQIFKPEIKAGEVIIQEGGIDSIDTFIPITESYTDIISTFPSKGYLKVDDEIIYYSGISSTKVRKETGAIITVNCFTDCIRSSVNTTSTPHPHGADVSLYSINVTNNRNYLDQTIVQMGDEWIGPLQREGTNYFVGVVDGGKPCPIIRGLAGTTRDIQTSGTTLIPVFATGNPYCGTGDNVTIIESDQTKDKEEQTIHLSRYYNEYLAAFKQNVTHEHPIDGVITRLLKFPSDELPSYLPVTFYIGSSCPTREETPIPFHGMIDEIRIFRTSKDNLKLNDSILINLPASGNSITMNNVSGLLIPSVIKIGDEIIGYVSIDASEQKLIDCQRGYLNSPVQIQTNGQRAFNLSFLPVAVLSTDISSEDHRITFTTSSTILPEGYLLADKEVIGYCWKESYVLSMPYDRNQKGIYRGSFGTNPGIQIKDTLLFALPFRYFDRYKNGAFDTSMAYFQAATKVTNAKWQRIRWDDSSSTLPDVRIKILARFNGKPTWDTAPTNKEGGIFEFTNPDAANTIGIESDQIELMSFFEYLQGAFNSNDWKHSPVLRGIWVEYEKPNLILTHEEN